MNLFIQYCSPRLFLREHILHNLSLKVLAHINPCYSAQKSLFIGMKTIVPFIVLLSLTGLACQQNASSTAHLGEVELQITGSPEAQTHFREGLLLLHSFEYDDARVAFEEALATDPACAMAYWGAAMTHNHSLWGQQNYAKGREILHRLDSLVEVSALTPLEQDFMAAVHILYGEQEDKTERNQAYADQMAVLHARYPGQHEIAAFYALSLLGSVPEGRDVEVFGQGARIAQGIMAENPQHPGALHYLIHSYDDPQHASLALLAANNYAKVAPDATHALHMPSHIYVALGMWDEVIRSNIGSYAASV